MPRPREAKPTVHLDARLKKSDYGHLTVLANTHGVLTALSIRSDVSNNLNPLSHAAAPIRLNPEKEEEIVSGCFTKRQKP